MDIKIRTKTKVSLIDCTRKSLGLYGKSINGELDCIAATSGERIEILGKYENEARAQEVLDQIQEIIETGLRGKKNGIIIQMPEN